METISVPEFLTARETARLLGGYTDKALHDPRTRKRLGLRAYRVGRSRSIRFRRQEVLALLRPETEATR